MKNLKKELKLAAIMKQMEAKIAEFETKNPESNQINLDEAIKVLKKTILELKKKNDERTK
jgi:hypothetical protein